MVAYTEEMLKVFATLSLVIISLTSWFYWKNHKLLAEARKLPTGRLSLPLLGHGYLMVYGVVGMINMWLEMIHKAAAQSIGALVLWVGPYPLFVITDPDDLKILLNSSKATDLGFEEVFLKYAMEESFPFATGNIWKSKRRNFKPLFHPRNMENIVVTANKLSRELTLSVLPSVGQGDFDVLKSITQFSIKSVNYLLTGPNKRIDIGDEVLQKIIESINRVSELAIERIYKVWLWPEFMFRRLNKKRINEVQSLGPTYFKDPIKSAEGHHGLHQSESAFTDIEEKMLEGEGFPQPITMVEVFGGLQNTFPGYSEEESYRDLFSLYFAGTETTSATLSSCVLALAAKPEIQEKVHAEIMSVVSSLDSDVTTQDIDKMSYLDQVVNETLRKFLIVPFLTRKVQSTLKLSSCTLPEGSLAGVSISSIHHNPTYYPNPENFDPDRFSPENILQRRPNCFIPFASGPRICIGKDYGMMVMKILIIHIIRKYKLSTTTVIDKVAYEGHPVPKLTVGYKVRFELR